MGTYDSFSTWTNIRWELTVIVQPHTYSAVSRTRKRWHTGHHRAAATIRAHQTTRLRHSIGVPDAIGIGTADERRFSIRITNKDRTACTDTRHVSERCRKHTPSLEFARTMPQSRVRNVLENPADILTSIYELRILKVPWYRIMNTVSIKLLPWLIRYGAIHGLIFPLLDKRQHVGLVGLRFWTCRVHFVDGAQILCILVPEDTPEQYIKEWIQAVIKNMKMI